MRHSEDSIDGWLEMCPRRRREGKEGGKEELSRPFSGAI